MYRKSAARYVYLCVHKYSIAIEKSTYRLCGVEKKNGVWKMVLCCVSTCFSFLCVVTVRYWCNANWDDVDDDDDDDGTKRKMAKTNESNGTRNERSKSSITSKSTKMSIISQIQKGLEKAKRKRIGHLWFSWPRLMFNHNYLFLSHRIE